MQTNNLIVWHVKQFNSQVNLKKKKKWNGGKNKIGTMIKNNEPNWHNWIFENQKNHLQNWFFFP